MKRLKIDTKKPIAVDITIGKFMPPIEKYLITHYRPNLIDTPVEQIKSVSIMNNIFFMQTLNERVYQYYCKNSRIACLLFNEYSKKIKDSEK